MSIEGLGSGLSLPLDVAVELHEDEVPDFDVAAAVAGEGTVGVSLIGSGDAHVVVNLAAGAAGTGVAHLPEIVFQAHLVDAILGHALRNPEVVGFRVAIEAAFAVENGHVQFFFVDAEPFARGDQFPCVGDGVFLEVVAERKISEHLEERVMAVGEADVFEIVVLAAGAHALLRSGGAGVVALFEAEEDVLELVHPGIGKQQRRIVGGDER